MAPQRRAAVAAERARDRLARVRHLGDLLGRPRQDLEVRQRHHDVVAVVAPGYLPAVGAVAEGLFRCKVSALVNVFSTGLGGGGDGDGVCTWTGSGKGRGDKGMSEVSDQ